MAQNELLIIIFVIELLHVCLNRASRFIHVFFRTGYSYAIYFLWYEEHMALTF